MKSRRDVDSGHYRTIVDSLQNAIFVLDSDGVVTDMNPSAERMLGVSAADVIGRQFSHDWEVFDEDGQLLSRAQWPLTLALLTGVTQNRILRVTSPLGVRTWLNVSSVPILPEKSGRPEGVITSLGDITSLKEKEAELEYSLHHDVLTGLPNRHDFFDRLNAALTAASPPDVSHGVLFIDLDGFKHINELYGYGRGDELLVSVATRLQRCVGPDDLLARLGADEFAVLLPRIDSVWQAARMAETVLQAIAEPFTFGTAEAQVELTVSIGIALAPCGRDLVATVARQANSALQGAKLSGKARFMIYDERQGARVRRKEMLERDLAQALARQEFSVLYQPIINLADESIHGMEALLRWHHPELGEVTPAEFIPLAESTGMIHSLGGWVIEEAVSRLGSWLGHDPGLLLAINLSPRQLESREFLRNFTHALGRHGVPHRNLMLELTETYLIQNVKRNARALDRFTDMGFSIAIDDFGSGYSSLKYLQHLPVTHLKIDRSFISESVHDARSLTLLEAIIQIADKLELTVIAEGVETPGQAETLRRAGCRLAQGFLFSNPLAAADLTALIGRR